MHPLTHRIYRALLRWYVTKYRGPIYNPYRSAPVVTFTHDLGRYVLFATFYYKNGYQLTLSHIRVFSMKTTLIVTEVY